MGYLLAGGRTGGAPGLPLGVQPHLGPEAREAATHCRAPVVRTAADHPPVTYQTTVQRLLPSLLSHGPAMVRSGRKVFYPTKQSEKLGSDICKGIRGTQDPKTNGDCSY